MAGQIVTELMKSRTTTRKHAEAPPQTSTTTMAKRTSATLITDTKAKTTRTTTTVTATRTRTGMTVRKTVKLPSWFRSLSPSHSAIVRLPAGK